MCRLRSFAVLSGRLQEHRRALEFSSKPYRVPRNVWNYLVYLPPARSVNKWAGYYALRGKRYTLGLGRTSPISALTDSRNCALCVSGAT
jgi:hypothetical protein